SRHLRAVACTDHPRTRRFTPHSRIRDGFVMGSGSLRASMLRTGIADQRRRSMLALTPILLALTLAGGQPAASDAWLPATGTDSCSVTDVDLADATHAFAAGAFNCGLVSSDGGRSWTAIEVVPQEGQSLLWAHAASADTLYAARRQTYRSDDGGANWVQLGERSEEHTSELQ